MFNFNNIDFGKMIKVTEIIRPLLAPQTISYTNIEGRAGSLFHRKIGNSFTIEIKFFFKSSSPADLMNRIRELSSKLDTEEPKKLIFNDEPDKYIMAIVNDTNFERDGKLGKGSIIFYCPDPYWYALSDDIINGTSGVKNYNRKGTTESYPIIKIKGSCNGGQILIRTAKSEMRSSCTFGSGDILIIDSVLLTAYVLKSNGTKISAIPYLDKLDFPVCYAGENLIEIKGLNGATVNSYELSCNSRWK